VTRAEGGTHEQKKANGRSKTPATQEKAQGKEEGSGSGTGTMKRVLLLTGKPGSGKTALIKEALAQTKVKASGFYTEELRVAGAREGFKIVTLAGQESILAHVNLSTPHQVSRYRVDTEALDRVAVPAILQAIEEDGLIVIDEIGKMELLSHQFRQAVVRAINSGRKILGTIMANPHPFADEIKRRPEVETVFVTRENRADVLKKILNWLAEERDVTRSQAGS